MLHRLSYLLLGLSVLLLNAVFAAPGEAAETVVIRYGPFTRSVSVADLQTYAETQKASPQLKSLLRSVGSESRQTVQEFLQVKVPLNVVAVDRLLRTEFGEKFLSETAQATVRRDDAGIPAIRAALTLGANSPRGLGVISFLEAYPSQRIVVDLPQALELIKTYRPILKRIPGL